VAPRRTPQEVLCEHLRTHNPFDKKDLDGFSNRSWLKAESFGEPMFDGRPVIGSANSWSEVAGLCYITPRGSAFPPSFLR